MRLRLEGMGSCGGRGRGFGLRWSEPGRRGILAVSRLRVDGLNEKRMIVLPVIERELRAAARHAMTYNLRVLGALALLGVLGTFWLQDPGGPGASGRLFVEFHLAFFFAIWMLVPLITADCLSRERREGTLPLLFLTRLRAEDIVYAKGLAHALRGFSLWLAVLPVFTVCFLGGGVDWAEVAMSALVNFSSVCLALGAGLVASSRTRVWTRAMAGASAAGFVLMVGFMLLLPRILGAYWWWSFGRAIPEMGDPTAKESMGMALNLQWMCQSWLFRRGPGVVVCSYLMAAALAALALGLLARFAAWNVRRTWQERPPTAGSIWWREKLFQPVLLRKQLRAWLRWQLGRNPIGWLEQRSWSGRLVVWSWFAVVACVYSSLFANLTLYQRMFHFLQTFLALLLAGSMAMSAAGSFRRERETGVLELLLVAPLRESQVIFGRVKGLWAQFLPAVVLLCAVWLYGATFLSPGGELASVLSWLVTFSTLPFVGLYFSLAKSNFIAALVWTLLAQLGLPWAALLLAQAGAPEQTPRAALILRALVECGVAAFLGFRLLVLLKRRQFVRATS